MTTVGGEFTPVQDFEEAPNYPVLFGVTITPAIGGVLIALAGLGIAAYLLVNFVQPLWQKRQELEASIQEKKAQVQSREQSLKQVAQVRANLETAKRRQADVLTLFANEADLDTLLLDFSRIIDTRKGTLVRFEPASKVPEVVTDSSLGGAVNNKLKRQVYRVQMEGGFEETRSIMLTLERLQPLLVVQNLNSELDKTTQQVRLRQKGTSQVEISPDQPPSKVKTSFDLMALLAAVSAPAPAPTPTPTPAKQ